jgi:hypothetical protein
MSSLVDNPEDYFRKLIPPRDDLMKKLEAEAEKDADEFNRAILRTPPGGPLRCCHFCPCIPPKMMPCAWRCAVDRAIAPKF